MRKARLPKAVQAAITSRAPRRRRRRSRLESPSVKWTTGPFPMPYREANVPSRRRKHIRGTSRLLGMSKKNPKLRLCHGCGTRIRGRGRYCSTCRDYLTRLRNPSRRAQRRRRPEVVDMGRWMSGSNPRRAKRRTPFLRNPSERAIMRKAMKAAWRKIKSR